MTVGQSISSEGNRRVTPPVSKKNGLNLKRSILIIAESNLKTSRSAHVPRPIIQRLATPDHLITLWDDNSLVLGAPGTIGTYFDDVKIAIIIGKELSPLVQKAADQVVNFGLDSYLVITNPDHISQKQKMKMAISGLSLLSLDEFLTEIGFSPT